MFGLAGDLLLYRVALAQGHGDELADGALLEAVAVEPRLKRRHHVVLWIAVQAVAPALAGDRVDLPGGDFHGARVVAGEVHPESLRLVHGQHHAAVLIP